MGPLAVAQVDQKNWWKYSLIFCAVPPRTLRKESYRAVVEKALNMGPEALGPTWVLPLTLLL